MLQHMPPLVLSPRFFSLFPNGKRKRVPFIFIVLPLGFCFKGKRTREKKEEKDRKDEDGYHLLFAMGDGTAVQSLWIVFCIFKREKRMPPNRKLSLSLSVSLSLSFFLSFFLYLALFPCPYLYLSLIHSQSLSISLSLCATEAGVLFSVCCVFKAKRKTSQKKALRGVPFARLTHRKRLKGHRFGLAANPADAHDVSLYI